MGRAHEPGIADKSVAAISARRMEASIRAVAD